jgi:hypothetical protein
VTHLKSLTLTSVKLTHVTSVSSNRPKGIQLPLAGFHVFVEVVNIAFCCGINDGSKKHELQPVLIDLPTSIPAPPDFVRVLVSLR